MTKKSKSFLIAYIVTIVIIGIIGFFIHKYNVFHYDQGIKALNKGDVSTATDEFSRIENYKDSKEQLDIVKKEGLYIEAVDYLDNKEYDKASKQFDELKDYKNSEELKKQAIYLQGIEELSKENYDEALESFNKVKGYKDSSEYIVLIETNKVTKSKETIYIQAKAFFDDGQYEKAVSKLNTISDYADSKELIEECKNRIKRKNLNNRVYAGVRTAGIIKSDDTVIVTGFEDFGQKKANNWKDIVSIDGLGSLTIGLTKDGEAVVNGMYDYNSDLTKWKEIDSSNWKNVVSVAAGEQFVLALKNDGTVYSDGHSANGQLEVDDWKDIISIDCGWSFSVGLNKNHELQFAGLTKKLKEEYNHNISAWKEVINISCGGGDNKNYRGKGHVVGLKEDGTVIAIGDNSRGQCNVSDWKDIVKISAGDWFTLGLTSDGKVLISNENPDDIEFRIDELMQLEDVADIAAGYGVIVCTLEDGSVKSFGFDGYGQRSGLPASIY